MLSGTWLVICNDKLKKCQGRQGEGIDTGSDAALCTLQARFSSAGIHQMDAFGCQQLNKSRFEGPPVVGLRKVCQCLRVSGFTLMHSSLLSSSSYTWWQRTVHSWRHSWGGSDVRADWNEWQWIRKQAVCCCWIIKGIFKTLYLEMETTVGLISPCLPELTWPQPLDCTNNFYSLVNVLLR